MNNDDQYPDVEDEQITDVEEDSVAINDPRGLALPDDVLPDTLYLLPISSRPFFPAQVQPVMVDADPWEDTLDRIAEDPQTAVGLVYVDKVKGAPPVESFRAIGCVARVHKAEKQNDKITFLAQGVKRFEVVEWLSETTPYLARVRYINDSKKSDDETKAYSIAILDSIKELIRLNPLFSEDLRQYIGRFSFNEPGLLADFAASITSADGKDLYEVLETAQVQARMHLSLTLIKKELEIARLQNEISAEVNDKISQHQREFFLKEQLKVIQKELGISKDDRTSDVETFEARLEGKTVPDAVNDKIQEELHKLSILETGSPEYGVTRNYLDWATSLPWGVHSADNLDISVARDVLESHHAGLGDIKDRIVEFLALGGASR
jgi:ATP-dependent Lon protease